MTKLISALVILMAFAVPAMAVTGAPHEWGWFFQEGHNKLNDEFIDFHNYLFIIITVITLIVLALIAYIAVRFRRGRNPVPSKVTHNTMLEVIWTVIPIIIVVIIMVPSLKFLYHIDRTEKADLTLKVTGYQWYWGYEYPEFGIEEFESRMIPTKDLKEGQKRLLEVDEPVYLPVGKTVRVLVTSDPLGVIHSWGVQSLGFKRDANPGRVNEGWLKIDVPGVYYGQCYELCGVDHAFMPIKIIALEEAEFNAWVASKGGSIPAAEDTAPESAAKAETKSEKKI